MKDFIYFICPTSQFFVLDSFFSRLSVPKLSPFHFLDLFFKVNLPDSFFSISSVSFVFLSVPLILFLNTAPPHTVFLPADDCC